MSAFMSHSGTQMYSMVIENESIVLSFGTDLYKSDILCVIPAPDFTGENKNENIFKLDDVVQIRSSQFNCRLLRKFLILATRKISTNAYTLTLLVL